MKHKRQRFFVTHFFSALICTSSFLSAAPSWSMNRNHIGGHRTKTDLSELLRLDTEQGLELHALGTAAQAAYKKDAILALMKTRMTGLGGYELTQTLGEGEEKEDKQAKEMGLRVQAWENQDKIIIAVRGTDVASELYQNGVLSDYGGIFFCGVHDYGNLFDDTHPMEPHVDKMLQKFKEKHCPAGMKALFDTHDIRNAGVKFYKEVLAKDPASAATCSRVEKYVRQKGKENLINSVILTLNFAAHRAEIAENTRKKEVVFTGHSLGGFIASAAGIESHASSVVWNAPGGVGSFLNAKRHIIRFMRVHKQEYKPSSECLPLLRKDQEYHYYVSRMHCPVASFGRHAAPIPYEEQGVQRNIKDFWLDNVAFTAEGVDEGSGVYQFIKEYSKYVDENHSMAILLWDLLTAQDTENRLGQLQMNFAHYKMGNHGVAALRDFTQLRSLNLTDNDIRDSGVTALSGLTNLTELNLSQNKLSLLGFVALSPLIQLEKLDLSDNEIITDLGKPSPLLLAQCAALNLVGINGTGTVLNALVYGNPQGLLCLGAYVTACQLHIGLNYAIEHVRFSPELTAVENLDEVLSPLRLPNLVIVYLSGNVIGRGAFNLISRLPSLRQMTLQRDNTGLKEYQKQSVKKALRKRFQQTCVISFE